MTECQHDDRAVAYALDAVDDHERAESETHLLTCPRCQEVVEEVRETAVLMSEGLEIAPPPWLRDSLMAQVRATPQLDATTATPLNAPAAEPADDAPGTAEDNVAAPTPLRSRRAGGGGRRSGWVIGLAAAAAVTVGAVAVTSWWPQDEAASVAQQVLEAEDAVRHTESTEQATVVVVESPSMRRSVLLAEELPGAPEGHDYQVWFVHEDGRRVSAGLLPRDDATGQEVLLEGDPTGAVAVGITLEPAGGSPEPTTELVVAVPLEG